MTSHFNLHSKKLDAGRQFFVHVSFLETHFCFDLFSTVRVHGVRRSCSCAWCATNTEQMLAVNSADTLNALGQNPLKFRGSESFFREVSVRTLRARGKAKFRVKSR